MMHLARQVPTDDGLGDAPRFDEQIEIDPGFYAQAVEHVNQVFGCEVAGGACEIVVIGRDGGWHRPCAVE